MKERELLDRLDPEAEAFDSAVTREHYLNRSGQKEELSLEPIFRRHRRLFSRETVEALAALRLRDSRLRPIRELAVFGYLEEAARPLTEELARRETVDTATWDSQQVPCRSLWTLVMNEADIDRRHELERLRCELTAAQNPIREARWGVLHARTRELGYRSYYHLCDRVGGLDLQGLLALMERFLWDTDKLYHDRLEGYLRSIGVSPALAERSDLSYLFRSPQFDAVFDGQRLLPALKATLRGLGIEPDHLPNVRLDVEPRPRKSPRAFCAPVRIPDEIWLVISPHGGQDDYRALFHEAGHAYHFAHVRREASFAHRGMGDNSVTEGFAFVLEHLVYNPAWLQEHLGLADPTEYLALARFHKLYMLRRYAAKLQYECDLHRSDDVRARPKRYSDLLTAALGVRYAPQDYLFDVDDGFYCARYVRAWIFEAQVRCYLESEFGKAWFRSAKAGRRLRGLWALGQRYPAHQLVRRVGYRGLDPGPLVAELTRALTD